MLWWELGLGSDELPPSCLPCQINRNLMCLLYISDTFFFSTLFKNTREMNWLQHVICALGVLCRFSAVMPLQSALLGGRSTALSLYNLGQKKNPLFDHSRTWVKETLKSLWYKPEQLNPEKHTLNKGCALQLLSNCSVRFDLRKACNLNWVFWLAGEIIGFLVI